jgi:hypothetical protein
MSRKMSPHQQSPRLRQLQQQVGSAPPLRSRNGGSPRQNGGGARVGDVIQTPQVGINSMQQKIKAMSFCCILK